MRLLDALCIAFSASRNSIDKIIVYYSCDSTKFNVGTSSWYLPLDVTVSACWYCHRNVRRQVESSRGVKATQGAMTKRLAVCNPNRHADEAA